MARPRIGLNGFGRIGRALARINLQQPAFEIAAINDVHLDNANLAYLLKYDSVYGRLSNCLTSDERAIYVDGTTIPICHASSVSAVPWGDFGVDFVIESSGDPANEPHIPECRSVRNVILTRAPEGSFPVQSVVFGVNESDLEPQSQFAISTLTCDATALGPILKVILETHEIEGGFLTTLHPWLSSQNLLCGATSPRLASVDPLAHYVLGRGAPMNVLPKQTSAIRTTALVLPEIADCCEAVSFRVPTSAVCSAHLVLTLTADISHAELVARYEEFERGQRFGILRNSTELLTSLDLRGEGYSAILDHRWTHVRGGRHVRLVYWYDNEWGYASRLYDTLKVLGDAHGI
jgi:glyceraldehyde 3-phosphate dehydrogenase